MYAQWRVCVRAGRKGIHAKLYKSCEDSAQRPHFNFEIKARRPQSMTESAQTNRSFLIGTRDSVEAASISAALAFSFDGGAF